MADPTEKRLITIDELKQVEKMAGIGLSIRDIGNIIGVSKSTMERRMKDQPEVAEAVERGRSSALGQVAKTAFQLAVSGQCPTMTIFWLKCRGGWSETDAVDENQNKYKAPTSLTRVA